MPKKCLRCGSTFGSEAEYCPHDGSLLSRDEAQPDPLIGTVLLEQFRVDERIGEGGMGTVYRAHQTTIGRDVAVKVLRRELAADEHAVVRFAREAKLATSLDHPNLVRVFLSGRLPDGRLYIVMELLEGRSLAEELEDAGSPSLERAVLIIMKLCAGLSAVHEAGVVHRDIKPENVFLVERKSDPDFVKVVDFGIARMLDGLTSTTQAGKVFGTATYISPEAASGEVADRRSDIYSLGVLSYQLLAGALPFEGSSVASVLMKHVHEPAPHLGTRGRGEEVPPEVADVVMQALSKDRGARQQNLAEFLDALAEAADEAGLLADARKLLLGTVWGEELTPPDSYLAELLAVGVPSSVPPPSVPSALEDTQRIVVERDPDDEALLSSAPKPFGTTSFEVEPARTRRRGKGGLIWGTIGLVVLMLAGLAAGVALFEPPETRAPKQIPSDATAEIVDTSKDSKVVVPEAPVVKTPVPHESLADAPTSESVERPPQEPKATKPKRKRRKPKVTSPKKPTPVTLEPDDGIDWTVPDFPDETGNPETPSGAPVVIDAPP